MYTLTQVILIAAATTVLVIIAIVALVPETDEEAVQKEINSRLRTANSLLREATSLLSAYKQHCTELTQRVQALEAILKVRKDHGL